MIRTATYSELRSASNFAELVREYDAECSICEIGRIDPQDELYRAMEKSGALHMFGVYDDALVGFIALLIYVLPHYGAKIATTESIFLARSHRGSTTGNDMLKFIEQFAKQQSCRAVLYSAPASSRFARLLAANRKRYRHASSIFVRSLA